MTSINLVSASLPPVSVPPVVPTPTSSDSNPVPAAADIPATPTNANENVPAVYNTLANESASTIRGVNLNLSV